MLSKEIKAQLVKEFGKDEKDTGDTAVQIALVTYEIKALSEHLTANKHDFQAKRALTIDVAKRRSLINYLNRIDPERLKKVKAKLGLK